MSSTATRRIYEDHIPSFMTVFDIDADFMADRETVTLVDSELASLEPKVRGPMGSTRTSLGSGVVAADTVHRMHISESNESSPTTFSTTDSSPLSDPSPSSSPDSPVNLIPLNNFPSTSFTCQASYGPMLSIPETTMMERPMTSPAPRRPRNMKCLSIQPPAALTAASRTAATEPSSPSFIKPKIAAMKRKPSQLSLKTSTSDLMSKSIMEVPASPAMPPILHRRALKHSTSSPHMLAALKSSTFGPSGGMRFHRVLERNESGLSEVLRPMKSSVNTEYCSDVPRHDSPIKTQLAHRFDLEPCQGSANNEDQKSPGYPDGPVAVYGDDVFLYSEPSAEEASRFDVVINVAREVKNPFDDLAQSRPQVSSTWPSRPFQSTSKHDSPVTDTAITTTSFKTAFEFQPSDDMSQETPSMPRMPSSKRPEYIHVAWDHNTDITPDLMRLCRLIESRRSEGKKILVHCQQGASRSASLIIAYGLFMRPKLSVNDAYYAVQAKSRWISPNMKLMYSLQDFHKELSKKRTPPMSALRFRTGRTPTKHRLALSADAMDTPSKEPQTAPLPGKSEKNNAEAPSHDGPSLARRTSSIHAVSPGPASAPMTCPWRSPEAERPFPQVAIQNHDELPQRPKIEPFQMDLCSHQHDAVQERTVVRTLGDSSPLSTGDQPSPHLSQRPDGRPGQEKTLERETTYAPTYPSDTALMSPRIEVMTKGHSHGFSHMGGMRFMESPSTPTNGLFSPREVAFPHDTFSFLGRTASFGRPPPVADPRSPPTRGEAPIIRSIDDVI